MEYLLIFWGTQYFGDRGVQWREVFKYYKLTEYRINLPICYTNMFILIKVETIARINMAENFLFSVKILSRYSS